MTTSRRQHIVVGIGNSAAGRAALSWAAREARLRGATLRVVRAWEPGWHMAPYAPSGAQSAGLASRTAACEELAAVIREVLGMPLPDGVTAEVAPGLAARVLVDRSASADLLVLGVITRPGRDERPTGPVVRACVAHAECPVVLVGCDAPVPAARREEKEADHGQADTLACAGRVAEADGAKITARVSPACASMGA